MTDTKELVKRLRADNSHWQSVSLYKEAAAFIESHDKPPLGRDEMREMLAKECERLHMPIKAKEICFGATGMGVLAALAFGEAIQRHFMGGE